MTETDSRELREIAKATAGVRDEVAKARAALERIVILIVVAMVLSGIFGLILLAQANKVTAPFG